MLWSKSPGLNLRCQKKKKFSKEGRTKLDKSESVPVIQVKSLSCIDSFIWLWHVIICKNNFKISFSLESISVILCEWKYKINVISCKFCYCSILFYQKSSLDIWRYNVIRIVRNYHLMLYSSKSHSPSKPQNNLIVYPIDCLHITGKGLTRSHDG